MILAIDVGNTNIVLGCLDKERILFTERLSTVRTKTELEYAVDIKTVLELYRMDPGELEGAVISSVVPQITEALQLAVHKVLGEKRIITLGPGVRTGLNLQMDNPASVGADLVAAAVAGLAEYPVPLILIDMGTATTVSVLDASGHYIGGMIYPGIGISLDALTERASQLSGINIEPPKRLIGRNTLDCMKSGILYSNAAAIDGIIDRIQEEIGQECTLVATGGLAEKIIPHCRRKIRLDRELILKGLLIIYMKNTVTVQSAPRICCGTADM